MRWIRACAAAAAALTIGALGGACARTPSASTALDVLVEDLEYHCFEDVGPSRVHPREWAVTEEARPVRSSAGPLIYSLHGRGDACGLTIKDKLPGFKVRWPFGRYGGTAQCEELARRLQRRYQVTASLRSEEWNPGGAGPAAINYTIFSRIPRMAIAIHCRGSVVDLSVFDPLRRWAKPRPFFLADWLDPPPLPPEARARMEAQIEDWRARHGAAAAQSTAIARASQARRAEQAREDREHRAREERARYAEAMRRLEAQAPASTPTPAASAPPAPRTRAPSSSPSPRQGGAGAQARPQSRQPSGGSTVSCPSGQKPGDRSYCTRGHGGSRSQACAGALAPGTVEHRLLGEPSRYCPAEQVSYYREAGECRCASNPPRHELDATTWTCVRDWVVACRDPRTGPAQTAPR
jgi:hypothetical protein